MDGLIQVRDSRQPNHFWADNEIVDNHLPTIGVHGFAVYMLLCRYANADGSCFPSIATMAKQLGLSEPTIRKAITKLENAKLITVERGRVDSKHGDPTSHLYTLHNMKRVVNDVDQGGKRDLPGVVNDVDPNNTYKNKTQLETLPAPESAEGQPPQSSEPPQPVTSTPKAKQPKPVKPRVANPVFDAIALGSFGMMKVPTKGGGRIAVLVRGVTECGMLPDDTPATLAQDLTDMYCWYKKAHPTLSAPASVETICKYLAEYRQTRRIVADDTNVKFIEHDTWVAPSEVK